MIKIGDTVKYIGLAFIKERGKAFIVIGFAEGKYEIKPMDSVGDGIVRAVIENDIVPVKIAKS